MELTSSLVRSEAGMMFQREGRYQLGVLDARSALIDESDQTCSEVLLSDIALGKLRSESNLVG